MKRIYKNQDAVFNLTLNQYPFQIDDLRAITFNFYTTNHVDCISKTEKDINDGVLVLKWDELKTLAEGVLFYDYVLDDGKIVTSEQNTSEYYIVTSSDIKIPKDGKDGATFTPSVDPEGNLSWTNDMRLENPETVNIKGPKGEKGDKGDKGDQGTGMFKFKVKDGNLLLATDNQIVAESLKIQDGELLYKIGSESINLGTVVGPQGPIGPMPIAMEIKDGDLYLLTDNPEIAQGLQIDSNGDLIYEIN